MRPRFRLYVITDRKLAAAHGGLVAAVEAALCATAAPEGSVAVQLREKDLGAHELFELVRALRVVCTRWGAAILVNDRLDVAVASGADGVHLPADSFSVADARAMLGPEKMVGVSTHRPGEIVAAAGAGADFAVFGPVYEPLSKKGYAAARASPPHAAPRQFRSMRSAVSPPNA
jgi:thiamine-phosphate pyrophosphorylase